MPSVSTSSPPAAPPFPPRAARRSLAARRPKRPVGDRWSQAELHAHLQWAVEIELYTIPFYMAAMFSVRDKSTEAVRLIRTVVNQEMLHLQLAANVASAFGVDVQLPPPVYGGPVPHISFGPDDSPDNAPYQPHATDIGPLDLAHLNTMCLIERPDLADDTTAGPAPEYRSIGDFYASLELGCCQRAADIVGNRNQVDVFSNFYPDMPTATVTADGAAGLPQVLRMLKAIVTQGEGRMKTRGPAVTDGEEATRGFIPPRLQNQADDLRPQADHFEKFVYLRGQPLPETWPVDGHDPAAGAKAQARLQRNFATLCQILEDEFNGRPGEFSPIMFQVGGDIVSCWKHGVLPTFS